MKLQHAHLASVHQQRFTGVVPCFLGLLNVAWNSTCLERLLKHTASEESREHDEPERIRCTCIDAQLLQLFNELKFLNLQFFLLKAQLTARQSVVEIRRHSIFQGLKQCCFGRDVPWAFVSWSTGTLKGSLLI